MHILEIEERKSFGLSQTAVQSPWALVLDFFAVTLTASLVLGGLVTDKIDYHF